MNRADSPINALLSRILTPLKRELFPPVCISCGETGGGHNNGMCGLCVDHMESITAPCCSRCGVPFQSQGGLSHPCPDCSRRPPSWRALRSVMRYGGSIREALINLKFRRRIDAAAALGRMIAPSVQACVKEWGVDLIVPVPTSRRRYLSRGYAHMFLICKGMGPSCAPLRPGLLYKRRHTAPLWGQPRNRRAGLIQGSLAVPARRRSQLQLKGKTVLVIDDIITTGATMEECARVLLEAGADAVYGLTIARDMP